MEVIRFLVRLIHLIFCVAIIVIVLLQSGKQVGLGTIAGGAETFFGKNKGRTIDAMLSKFTSFAAILFLITSLVLGYIINAGQG